MGSYQDSCPTCGATGRVSLRRYKQIQREHSLAALCGVELEDRVVSLAALFGGLAGTIIGHHHEHPVIGFVLGFFVLGTVSLLFLSSIETFTLWFEEASWPDRTLVKMLRLLNRMVGIRG